MTVDNIPRVVQYFLEEHGLVERGWVFKWDSAKRRAGVCRYQAKVIGLSRHYVELNIAHRFDDIVDTILHEIAHALAGPSAGHGQVWKDTCLKVGARPQRCCDTEVVLPEGKWQAVCNMCNNKYSRHKQVARGTWRYCLKCGPVHGRLTYCLVTDAPPITAQGTPPTPRKLR